MKECDPFNFDTIRCICSHKSSPMCNLIMIERLHVLLINKFFYSQSVCKMKIIFLQFWSCYLNYSCMLRIMIIGHDIY